MSDTNRKLAISWFEEVWNKARREAIAELLAPDSILHDGPDSTRGPEGLYPFYERLRGTFPDMHMTVEDSIAEGDKVCVRWSCKMTHNGDGLGIPATGKACTVTGITIMRVAGGKFVEAWQNWDMLGLLQQIQGTPKAATYLAAPPA